MLQNYIRQLLVFAFILVSFTALGQSFGTSVSARYGDGCRLDFYNSTNVKIFSLRGSELRYWYNPSGQIIVRDENTQVTDLYGITGLAALIDSVQSVCLAGLCGGSTPIETFAYCGAPVLDFWQQAGAGTDTLISSVGSFWSARIDETQLSLTLSESTLLYDNYPYNLGLTGGSGGCGDYQNQLEVNALLCTEVLYFEATLNNQLPELIENTGCPSADITDSLHYFYNEDVNYDTLSNLKTISITSSGDTSIKSDYFIRCCGTGMLRNLGVTFQANTGIVLDTTDNTITLTAYPVKTSGQTYAASSFKIEKIAFADISAGTISGSAYNPNSGEQSNTFNLTTGKNTFKVSVEDTDGNVAYSIFQVTKTAL